MILPRLVTISWDGGSVDLYGPDAWSGLVVSSDGITGWDSAPDAKVSVTERQSGNGAHDIRSNDIHYQSRVVTIGVGAFGRTRDETLAAMRSLSAAQERLVTMRVVDASSDTYCAGGYVRVEWKPDYYEGVATGTLTATFVRPERLSTTPSTGTLVPSTGTGGGLVFAGSSHVLHWPLSFGAGAIRTGNVCTIHNNGTIPADVIITASGNMPQGLAITDVSTGKQLAYGWDVTWQPVTFDSRTRMASVAGVDVSRGLTSHDFPTVPAGGSITLSLAASGSGTVTAVCRDTYI
jgi:hypothetical protein